LDIVDVEIAGKSVTVSKLPPLSCHLFLELSIWQFDIKPKHEVMGSALHIDLPSTLESGQYVDVKIIYQTTKDGTALQWLDREWVLYLVLWEIISVDAIHRQTQGKMFPYLFSQCQPIYARALVPLQGPCV
jgi:leukotriene-A4 hydrolase